ncbi:MAG: DinB family protein [Herpetosiphon sp.]|nr:DinB family protein [Herpetosiphon sp.]
MQPDTLTTLFQHHRWANLRLIEACRGLTDEQRDASVLGGFGSIRDTLHHIVLSEQSYFSRISTGKRAVHSPDDPPMTLDEIAQSLQHTATGLIEWSAKIQADEIVEIDWDGELRDVPKTILFTQAINHATEHRAQIMTILTQLGVEPPELSGWAYFDEQVYHS